ncbi:hypothetical protein NXG27_10250 [Megasphaera paucivorans]|uniref:Pilus assembly protein Flp/PilA n=1 Tax=Megasphaera paucivorans TaxID=349095 RepID=A0A1G9UPR1_9FIRM|nr:hypothetical protein [Megasphaera paucivorans]SDM61942.1 hypothetical protein SAMN05660299_01215 [Megasphaera paucivorans]
MLGYIQYVMNRYAGEKGQGLTEYAIILLLVVLIGVMIWFGFHVRGSVSMLYSKIGSDLSSIASSSN